MTSFEAHEKNVQRLYPRLLKIVEKKAPADAGAALCIALTILAWRQGICLESLLFMTRDTIKKSWRELSAPQQSNGEEEDGETQIKGKNE